MRSAAAYAPGHITGFLHIADNESDALHKGSLGAGFSIEAGVTTHVRLVEISPSDPLAAPGNESLRTRISINGSLRSDSVVSQEVVDSFLHRVSSGGKDSLPLDRKLRSALLSVEHHVAVPEGTGFGSSGAAALSLAYALNALFEHPLSRFECGQLAHSAEISCGTGLGTVIGEFVGGCEIRIVPGAPGIGSIERFDPGDLTVAIFVVYGPLSTKRLLGDQGARERFKAEGRRYLDLLLRDRSAPAFLRLSREFAEGSGLISERVRSALEMFDRANVPASMLMFGDGVFTLVRRGDTPRLRRMIDKEAWDAEVLVSAIQNGGGAVVGED